MFLLDTTASVATITVGICLLGKYPAVSCFQIMWSFGKSVQRFHTSKHILNWGQWLSAASACSIATPSVPDMKGSGPTHVKGPWGDKCCQRDYAASETHGCERNRRHVFLVTGPLKPTTELLVKLWVFSKARVFSMKSGLWIVCVSCLSLCTHILQSLLYSRMLIQDTCAF